MTFPLFMSKARKWIGLFAFWGILFICVFGYPSELNVLLGVSDVLSAGDKLNGPNDMTMLIRMALGMVLGVAADIFLLKALGKLFPMSVLTSRS